MQREESGSLDERSSAKRDRPEEEFFSCVCDKRGALILFPQSLAPEDITTVLLLSPTIARMGAAIVTERQEEYTRALGNPGLYLAYNENLLSTEGATFVFIDDPVAFSNIATKLVPGRCKPVFLVASGVTPEEVEAMRPWFDLVGYISPTYFGPKISLVLHEGTEEHLDKIRRSSEIDGVHVLPESANATIDQRLSSEEKLGDLLEEKTNVSHIHFPHGTTPENYRFALSKVYKRKLYTVAVPILFVHYYSRGSEEESQRWKEFSTWMERTASAFRSLCSEAKILTYDEGFYQLR